MNDTPRKDHLIKHAPIGLRPIPAFDQAVELVDALERQLNAANERIKRLEEAGDVLCAAAAFMGWHMEIEKWNKAKEAKL
jgi:hypothetical protein